MTKVNRGLYINQLKNIFKPKRNNGVHSCCKNVVSGSNGLKVYFLNNFGILSI